MDAEVHMLPCFFKQTTGIDCPGCGLQRAFWELIQGHWAESFALFPALIPLILLFLFTVLHLVFKFKHGASTILILFIANVIIIQVAYMAKLFL